MASTAPLLEFASDFIAPIDRYEDVRTEALAEAFRGRFDLPPFPALDDLSRVCEVVGVDFERKDGMPAALPGLNLWHGDGRPSILIEREVSARYAETTLGHELREVIENAFKRVKPEYASLDTSNNTAMNAESDQFAGCLLMQAEASRARLREIGFDYARFSEETRRSLSSVIERSRQLFPSKGADRGPVMGLWLFEAPWESVVSQRSGLRDMVVRHEAHLSGFSMRRSGPAEAALAWRAFPRRGSVVTDCPIAAGATEAGVALVEEWDGFDMFGERNFVVAAEPFFFGASPWRLLLAAVRRDGLQMVLPWLRRLAGSGGSA